MLQKGNRGQEGSISVEAAISLSAFLFMFVMLYSIVTICRTQAEIGSALNSSAKEISQYSYLYGLTGLDKSFHQMYQSGRETVQDADELIANLNEALNGIQSLGGKIQGASTNISNPADFTSQWDGLVTGTKDGAAQIQGSLEGAKESLSAMAEDPKSLLIGLTKVFAAGVLDKTVSHFIAEPVAKVLVKKHLKRSDNDDPNLHLKAMGVVTSESGSLDAIDFSSSTIFANGSDDIILVARYQMELMPLLPIEIKFDITQSAATKGWLHGDGSTLKPGPSSGGGSSTGGNGGKEDANSPEETEKPAETEKPPEPGTTVQRVSYSDRIQEDENHNKVLKPNIQFTTPNGYTYTTDENGRVVKVTGNLKNSKGSADTNAQKKAGGEDRGPNDDGGHLIALQFGGSGEFDNLVPINKDIKEGGGEWYNMEKEWKKAVDAGKEVAVDIECTYPGDSKRPAEFVITYEIEGVPGKQVKKIENYK